MLKFLTGNSFRILIQFLMMGNRCAIITWLRAEDMKILNLSAAKFNTKFHYHIEVHFMCYFKILWGFIINFYRRSRDEVAALLIHDVSDRILHGDVSEHQISTSQIAHTKSDLDLPMRDLRCKIRPFSPGLVIVIIVHDAGSLCTGANFFFSNIVKKNLPWSPLIMKSLP